MLVFPSPPSLCCGLPLSRPASPGKHKCSTCDSPVLVCTRCLNRGAHKDAALRCPLCVEEGRQTKQRSMHHEVTVKAQTTTAKLQKERLQGRQPRPWAQGSAKGGGEAKPGV